VWAQRAAAGAERYDLCSKISGSDGGIIFPAHKKVKEMDTVWKGESAVKDALTRARAAMDPVLQEALAQSKVQGK
jgi:hypothetical protein